MAETSTTGAQDFVGMLPLYHRPLIKINIKPSNTVFTISKDLLCAESPVSTIMFNNGSLKESQEQALDLEEMDDVMSARALEAFLQWLYRGVMRFNVDSPEVNISGKG